MKELLEYQNIIIGLGVISLFFAFFAISNLFKRNLLSFGSFTLLAGISAISLALVMNLYTYNELTNEDPVAAMTFSQVSPQLFNVRLTYPDGKQRNFELHGDEWQLDARVLKWTWFSNLFGMDTIYRIERLSGRYRDAAAGRTKPRSVYNLGENQGLDLWRIASKYPEWFPFVDAIYGSATYMPMASRAAYLVSVSQSGLIARAANEAAASAIRRWN